MAYPAFVVCHPGMEDMAAIEIKRLLGIPGKPGNATVAFSAKSKEDLVKLIYLGQSISKVCLSLASFTVKKDPIEELGPVLGDIDFSPLVEEGTTFRVHCHRDSDQEVSSQEVAEEAGGFIIDAVQRKQGIALKVDLEHAPLTVFIHLQDQECSIGIDLAPLDLSKRPYKLFTTALSMKASIAHSLLDLAGYDGKEVLVDPFCRDGVIPIEACLQVNARSSHAFTKDGLGLDGVSFFSGVDTRKVLDAIDAGQGEEKIPAYGYASQLPFLSNAKKNAKVADVHKLVEFSKVDVEWLDTKFDKGKVGLIATRPPEANSRTRDAEIEKVYKELFYQADFVLGEDGKVVLLVGAAEQADKWAAHYRFRKLIDRKVWQGKMELHALVFSRQGREETETKEKEGKKKKRE